MKKTFLVLIGVSLFAFADFTKTGDVVTDNHRGLMWQDDLSASTTAMTWQDAISHCEELTLDGHNDWRLPNIRELDSIVNSRKVDPAIYSAFENTSLDNYYWSSTTDAQERSVAWGITFHHGASAADSIVTSKDGDNAVRCVRSF